MHNTPVFTSQGLGLQVCTTTFGFMWWWGLNPRLHACQASTLLTGLHPQPCFFTPLIVEESVTFSGQEKMGEIMGSHLHFYFLP